MSFRKIRPLSGEWSADALLASTAPSTTHHSGYQVHNPLNNKDGGDGGGSTSKRRRVPDSVTRNACLNCKKARAKCDGEAPCRRCSSRVETSECVYEVHIKHAKEELVKQIKELKAKDHLTDQILNALSSGEQVPEILDRLKRGETYHGIVDWLGRSPIEGLEPLSPQISQRSAMDVADHEMGDMPTSRRWSSVTSDQAILDHLFQLYFCWVHPVHTLLSEGIFVRDYQAGPGSDGYCSSTLVNAMCAMACHLHAFTDVDEVDFEQLGEQFSDAALSSLNLQDHRLAMTQSFAVLFLVDCARSKGLRAAAYLKNAALGLLNIAHQDAPGFEDVRRSTIRGVRNLNVEWSQVTCEVPTVVDYTSSNIVGDADAVYDNQNWYHYRNASDDLPPPSPGMIETTNREKSKLISIIQDVIWTFYFPSDTAILPRTFLQLYKRFLDWREALPTTLLGDLENHDDPALPHVLSLLILYSGGVVQLLHPLLEFEGVIEGIEEVIWKHAQTGLYLLDERYRSQYTCRYQPVLQMFGLLQLSDLVARNFPGGKDSVGKDGQQAIYFGMEALMQSRLGFPTAGPLQEMLRSNASRINIQLPPNLNEIMTPPSSPRNYYLMDDMIDACTRPTYLHPLEAVFARMQSSFTQEWVSEASAFGFLESTLTSSTRRVASADEAAAQGLMRLQRVLNSN
ncbi:hypothetical protein BJ875DRAFT_366647 [Amylocarpus encephaloides]|uniref:Zn(2)-C6 fungal-type domain-containing protein n=1 Tax=Amylocarpus encephaloides TaxID=45428 RepID=A0A9P7YSE3_9HELO|nr:hypothetical protein BJ875DRAFT_366647 [Amylocarpus encephaloides]